MREKEIDYLELDLFSVLSKQDSLFSENKSSVTIETLDGYCIELPKGQMKINV